MGLEDKLKDMRWIISSAVNGARPQYKQLASMETYSKKNNAEIGIIPIVGQYRDLPYHDVFSEYNYLEGDVKLSKKLKVIDMSTRAQQRIPLTGKRAFGQTDVSFIMGSPKQQLEIVANSPMSDPKAIMTTGACTLPDYRPNQIGKFAREDHKQGGLLIDIDDTTGNFHYRQFQVKSDGSFIDLGTQYFPNGRTSKVKADVLVIGDMHEKDIVESAYQATKEQLKLLKPKYAMLHDIFDGQSISHHEHSNLTTKGRRAQEGLNNLESELQSLYTRLTDLCKSSPETQFISVKSNHDEVLSRYLSEGRYIGDHENLKLALKLAYHAVEGKDPLEEGLKEVGGKLPKNFKMLQRKDEFKRYGNILSMHGDKGNSGARASAKGLSESVGKGMFGHIHSPSIFRDIYYVGCNSSLRPSYAAGTPGKQMHCNGVLYEGGQRQLINMFDGKWRL